MLYTILSLSFNLKELYIAARTENLKSEEMGQFKNLLISFKKLTSLKLDIDFDLSSTIAEMRNLKTLKFFANIPHSFT
jgi:hypothetical protein